MVEAARRSGGRPRSPEGDPRRASASQCAASGGAGGTCGPPWATRGPVWHRTVSLVQSCAAARYWPVRQDRDRRSLATPRRWRCRAAPRAARRAMPHTQPGAAGVWRRRRAIAAVGWHGGSATLVGTKMRYGQEPASALAIAMPPRLRDTQWSRHQQRGDDLQWMITSGASPSSLRLPIAIRGRGGCDCGAVDVAGASAWVHPARERRGLGLRHLDGAVARDVAAGPG
jgi:hypothetical protein